MKQFTGKARLYAGAATMAVITGWTAPAAAQCVTDTNTVNCSGTVTSDQVNTAVNGVTPPNVTVRVATDATVTRTAPAIQPSSTFTGAVDIANAGTVGSTAAPVGVAYSGSIANSANTFSIANSGLVTGAVSASNVGGAITATNSGTLAGGVQLQGAGSLSLTSSGPVYVSAGGAGTTAVNLQSRRIVETRTGTAGVDALVTSTSTAGAVNATITGPVAIPAAPGGTATRQGVQVISAGTGGSARLALDAAAGAVTVSTAATDSSFTPGVNVVTVDGTTTARSSTSSTQVGGAATAIIGANAQIGSLTVQAGRGSANASIAGRVGSTAAPGFVSVTATGSDLANSSETVTTAAGSVTRNARSTTPVGGAASLEISDTGQVVGPVTVASNASSAAATVAGALGGIDGSTFVGGSLFVDARGTRTTNTDTSTVAGAANSGASASSSAVSTGTASATVATSGRVLGSVNALASGGAATTTISGAVGATGDVVVTGNAVADSRGATTSQNSAFANAANGDSTSNSTFSQTNTGGTATTTIAAGGSVAGNANAISNASDAAVTVAGTVGAGDGATIAVQGNVLADTRGINSTRARTDSFTAASNDYTFAEKTTQTLSGGAASATTAATGAVFGNMTAIGDRGATIDNAGRVRDFAQASSTRSVLLSNESSGSRVTTPGSGGASSVVTRNAGASVIQTGGGTASLTNRAGGVIEDGAFVSGAGGASFTNAGAIFGNVSVTSTGSRQENTNTSVSTLTSTPQPAGGAIVRQEDVSSQTSTVSPVGGAATGVYGGTIGAAQGSSLAANTTVNQVGQTGSTATVSGTLFADLSTSVGATRTESTSSSSNLSVTQAATGTATPAVETTGSSTSRNSATAIGAANTVTVTGALRNNGFGTGDLFASGNAGTTTVTIDGGTIAGSVNASSAGSNTINGSDSAFRNTRAATAAGPVAPLVAQSQSSSNYSEQRRTAGTASVALTGTARVEGAVTVSGVGTGAGSTGAAATVASTAAINGALSVNAGTGTDARSDSSSVSTRTGPAAVTRTDRFSQTTTRSANAGNANATIAGTVGGQLTVNAPYGNASATLSGQVLNGGGITIASGGTLNSSSSEQSYRGTSTTTLSTPIQTAATSQSTSTATGGAANLSIASAGTTAAGGLSAVNGSITVGGFAGSALTIGAGTRVLATNGGSIFVGRTDYNFAQSSSATFNAAGARTGQTDVATYVAVGAPASISNAGIIGASTGFYGAPVTVEAFGVAGASVANTGTIYGNVIADALSYDYTSTTTQSGLTDPVTQQSVFVATTTLVGGLGAVSNAGVVSGNVAVSGATGTIANSGVIRGGATLGSSVFAGTETSTQTATNNSYVQAAPTARFVQSYTLNQNGLLLGGVAVRDPRVTDFSTGAASNATLRTSDIRATINLNNGSITTGNITAPVDTANARLSDTTLNLVGAGYLGAGTGLTPPAALGVGAAPLRYENTPNFAGFAAIDPALGNSASGTFLPSVGIASGSRISGVNLVDRSGAGVFTVVGAPYLSVSNANPLPVYTMDVGTLRISSGELQLGVAGADPATGAAIFAVRGNVVNNGGTLLLGRRVTDGTTSVVQGVNLRVDGNFTQAAGGTLSLAASPSLVRIAGTQVGALPAAGVLGFGGYGVALTPFVPFDPLATNQLRSTPSTLTVNGNLTLAGSVSIAAQPGAIYTAGRNADLITVSGTYNGSGLTVLTPSASPFVRFVLTPRTVGTQTVVSVDVARTSYASVTTTSNAGAAATALDAAVPSVVARLRAIPNPNAVTDVAGYAAIQDLATVISALDTQLSASDAAIAFNQLGSGSVYGSLSALATTAPFGDAAEAPIGDEGGIGLWARPSGLFSRFSGDGTSGAGRLRADNYGGALGVSISTGEEGVIGFGGGYGRIDARDKGFPSNASADTYMIGAFGRQRYEGFDLAVQAVFGWSNWDTVRALPLFSRTATASFDSSEFRLTARVAYDLSLSGVILTPFGRLDMRRYSFEAFQEQNAGGIGLNVGRRRDRVISPEAGVRVGGEVGIFRPFAEASYVFQGDTGSERRVSYIGDPANSFRLRGVDPEGYARIGAGISADAYGASFNLRGTYLAGGGNRAGEVLGGVTFRF